MCCPSRTWCNIPHPLGRNTRDQVQNPTMAVVYYVVHIHIHCCPHSRKSEKNNGGVLLEPHTHPCRREHSNNVDTPINTRWCVVCLLASSSSGRDRAFETQGRGECMISRVRDLLPYKCGWQTGLLVRKLLPYCLCTYATYYFWMYRCTAVREACSPATAPLDETNSRGTKTPPRGGGGGYHRRIYTGIYNVLLLCYCCMYTAVYCNIYIYCCMYLFRSQVRLEEPIYRVTGELQYTIYL